MIKGILKFFAVSILAAVGVVVFLIWSISENNFSNADIVGVKKSITAEFEKRPGISVTEVQIFKESASKGVGYVKLHAPGVGDVTKGCTVTLAEDRRNYVWRCD